MTSIIQFDARRNIFPEHLLVCKSLKRLLDPGFFHLLLLQPEAFVFLHLPRIKVDDRKCQQENKDRVQRFIAAVAHFGLTSDYKLNKKGKLVLENGEKLCKMCEQCLKFINYA